MSGSGTSPILRSSIAYAPPSTRKWVDIGSGAGFPGLVVAIMRRDWSVTLIEPRRLRVEWLEQMKKEWGSRR
jgi:16S rRNA (guanine527-N7)-methyltransferase